jgi:Flp pilus assembly pilin Flp
MTEYAIVMFFIAILMIGAVGFFGRNLGDLFEGILDLLPF